MRILRIVSTAACTLLVLLPVAGVASAQPNEQQQADVVNPGDITRFAFTDLGLGGSTTVDLTGRRTRLTVPIPAGSTPSTLNAVLTTPAWLGRGWVDVESDGRPIARITLDNTAPTTSVSIPLVAASTTDGMIALDLIPSLVPDDRYCPAWDSDAVRLIDATVDYLGQPVVPRTIAEFLPVVLRKLTVFVPAEPDHETASAATTVATSVVHHYGAQPVRVTVRPDTDLQGAPPDGPWERSIVLTQNTDAGVRLIYPVEQAPPRMFLSGTGSELADQARLITSDLSAIALGTAASAGPTASKPQLAPDSVTLDDLGIGTVTGSGSNTATVSFTVDQTQLGRSAEDLSVHLIGSYTPGAGSVRATVNGSPLEVWQADDTGRLDRWIDIPDSVLSRVETLDIAVEHPSGINGGCGTAVDSTVTVDGSTSIRSADSSTPAPLGVRSMPQALMPRFEIALADESYDGVVRAVMMATGLQRLSSLPLMPEVVSMDEALDGSAPAVVIAPVADLPAEIALPLSSSGETTFRISDPVSDGAATELTVDTVQPFATMQVTSVQNKALLVASWNSAPDQFDAMLSWLNDDSARWFALSGDIVFVAPNTDPMSLSSSALAGADETGAAGAGAGASDRTTVLVAAIGCAVLLVAVVAALVFAIRSRHSTINARRQEGSK